MASSCPPGPNGEECERTDEHTFHRHQGDWNFITWGVPDPIHRPVKRGKKKGPPHSKQEMIDAVHRVLRTDPTKLSRRDDPETSAHAAKAIRSGSQKHRLLLQYATAKEGLTDEEAADRAGLLDLPGCCWWHRSSDLREEGRISDTGQTRVSPRTGEERMVCVITDEGMGIL